MKITKIVSLCLLTLALLVALVSCGGEKPPVEPDGTGTPDVTQAPDVTGTPDNPVEELPKIENLKLNGTPISEYKIVTKGSAYGAKYASELLQKQILALTGHKLTIASSASGAAFYLESIDSKDGKYYIDVEGNSVTLKGTGLYGATTAAKALLDTIGRNENATIESVSAPMLALNNAKKKLEAGSLSIGYMGDSIMEAKEGGSPMKSYTVSITEHLQQVYPNANITMKNHSIGGKNTTWGLYSMEEELLSAGYDDLIFISLGTNDGPYGNDYTQTALNYQAMIEKIYKNDPEAEIVFVTHGRKDEMRSAVWGGIQATFITAMLDVATYYDIPVIDVIYEFASVWNNTDEMWNTYIYDTVHPNQAGHNLYGDILWKTLSVAFENSDGAKSAPLSMPSEPLFENGKADAVKYSWDSIKDTVVFGTGDESGWASKGRVTKAGASITIPFEGIGLEFGTGINDTNPFMLLIQIFDENGELVFEKEMDTAKYYNYFITNELEYGKYTVKMTATRASEQYPSDRPSFALTEIMIIK